MLRLYLMLFIIGSLSAAAYSAYTYYITTQETIRVLAGNNAKLEIAVATSEEAMNSLKENYAAVMEENNKISLGGYLQYINPIKDSNSKISQTILA